MQTERTRIKEKCEAEEKLSPDLLSLHILDQSHFRRKVQKAQIWIKIKFFFSFLCAASEQSLSRKVQTVLWMFLRPGPSTRGARDGENICEVWLSRVTGKKTKKRWERGGEDEGRGRRFCVLICT